MFSCWQSISSLLSQYLGSMPVNSQTTFSRNLVLDPYSSFVGLCKWHVIVYSGLEFVGFFLVQEFVAYLLLKVVLFYSLSLFFLIY
jgi:hypothetical protein